MAINCRQTLYNYNYLSITIEKITKFIKTTHQSSAHQIISYKRA